MSKWGSNDDQFRSLHGKSRVKFKRVHHLEIGFIATLLMTILLIPGFPQDLEKRRIQENDINVNYYHGVYDGLYWVYIGDTYNISLYETGYKILDNGHLIDSPIDPSGKPVRMEGDNDDIKFIDGDYENAMNSNWPNSTFNELFYADYPTGRDNQTLFIVFMDHDDNDKISTGDIFWIRPTGSGGTGEEGKIFRLYVNWHVLHSGDLVFPAISSEPKEPGDYNKQKIKTTSPSNDEMVSGFLISIVLLSLCAIIIERAYYIHLNSLRKNRILFNRNDLRWMYLLGLIGAVTSISIFFPSLVLFTAPYNGWNLNGISMILVSLIFSQIYLFRPNQLNKKYPRRVSKRRM